MPPIQPLDIDRTTAPIHSGTYRMSAHAMKRMYRRGLNLDLIAETLSRGEVNYDRGAKHFRIGRRTAAEIRAEGGPADRLEGLHVIVSTDGNVLTVYRNRDFRRPRKTHRHVRGWV